MNRQSMITYGIQWFWCDKELQIINASKHIVYVAQNAPALSANRQNNPQFIIALDIGCKTTYHPTATVCLSHYTKDHKIKNIFAKPDGSCKTSVEEMVTPSCYSKDRELRGVLQCRTAWRYSD